MIAQSTVALLHAGPHNSSETWIFAIGLSLVLLWTVWHLASGYVGGDQTDDSGEVRDDSAGSTT